MNRKNSLGDFPVVEAVFIRRPNRFVVICTVNGQETTAYMPNPGRMWELLFSGAALYVKKNPPEQKMPYTILAVKREKAWIMLHTHWANDVAEVLLRSGKVPGLETAAVVRREIKFGQHRFDFLLTKDEKPYYLEVKSCTLFEGAVAMFPDAITERGRSHVETLTQLAQSEVGCGVLILIHWPYARYFLPDYHTDFAFAKTFCAAGGKVDFYPLALKWQPDLTYEVMPQQVVIPWGFLKKEVQDSGYYLALFEVPAETAAVAPAREPILLLPGYYLYAAKVRENLTQAMNRLMRRPKKPSTFGELLRSKSASCKVFAIRTTEAFDEELHNALGELALGQQVISWSSDEAKDEVKLYKFAGNPVQDRQFIALLQFFRIKRLMADLELESTE